MPPRLPIVGSDTGTWGTLLNTYLGTSIQADGKLKNRELNLMDYGATGNGTTDDTNAVKAARDAASTLFDGTGPAVVIVVPPGTYKLTSVVEIPPGVILRGLSGRFSTNLAGATFFKSHDGVAIRLVRQNASPGSLFHMGGVEDICFTGNGASDTTASRFIELGNASSVTTSVGAWNVFVRRCMFNNSYGYGVYSAHSQEAEIDFNWFRNVKFPIYYGTVVASAKITRNSMYDDSAIAGSIAMQFRRGTLGGASSLVVANNYALAFERGFFFTSINGLMMIGNSLEGIKKQAIELTRYLPDETTQDGDSCEGFVIEGNTFINWGNSAADFPAIELDYARYGYVGVNTYSSPNGAVTATIKVFDDGVTKTEKNIIVEPVISPNPGGGSPVPFQLNNSKLAQNTLIGRDYLQYRQIAGDISTAGFGGGEDGRRWWDNTNKRFRHWSGTNTHTMAEWSPQTLTYSASITPNTQLGNEMVIVVTNGTAFTINEPTNGYDGMTIIFTIKNSSGGAMGAITWNGNIRLAGAFTNPANTNQRSICFKRDTGAGLWYELWRTAADVAN